MNFKQPAVPYFYYIADQVGIVPQHIWSKIANPVTFTDTHPIGTGPYMVQPVHAREHHLHGEPELLAARPAARSRTVQYPAFTSNNTANTYLANGQAQWGSQFIPASRSSTPRRARTTTTGSRRR